MEKQRKSPDDSVREGGRTNQKTCSVNMWVGILHRPIWPSEVNAGVCGLIMTDSIIGFLCFLISAASTCVS